MAETLNRYSLDNFTGGIAEGTKRGYKDSFNDGLGLDFRTDPDKLQVMPPLAREKYLDGLVRFIERESSDTWLYTNSGTLYRRNSAEAYDYQTTIASSTGNGLSWFNNAMYYAGTATLNKMTTPAGTPTLVPNYFISTAVVDNFINKGDRDLNLMNSHPQGYTTTASISEAAADKISLIPNKVSFAGIVLYVTTINSSSAYLILTLHDNNNTVIWQKSVLGSTLTAGKYNRIDPAAGDTTPVTNLVRGGLYHLHITYTGGGTFVIGTSTASDLSTMSISTFFRPIESGTDHMMQVFQNKLCYCNNRFMGTIDDAEVLNSEAMTFPPDEVAHCLETIGDYIAVATWNGTTAGASGRSRIYFWDGTAVTFNSFIDVTGQVNAMITHNNQLFVIHGTQNMISIYTGALTLVRRIKFVGQTYTSLVAEGGLSTWEGVVIWGILSGTAPIDRAIYTLGSKSKDYPDALNKDFRASNGLVSNKMSTGAVYGLDSENLFVCWQDTTPTTVTDTASSSSTGSTLVATGNIFTLSMVGRQVKNTTDNTYRVITGYTNATTVTVDVAINNDWDGDAISVGNFYWIDNIDITKKETTAYVATLRYDGEYPNFMKTGNAVSLRTMPLLNTQSIAVYYRLNSVDNPNTTDGFTYLGEMNGEKEPGIFYKSFDLSKQFFEIEFKLVINGDGTSAATILSFELYYDVQPNYQAGSESST